MAGRAAVAGLFRGAPGRVAARLLEALAGAPRGAFGVLTYHRVDEPAATPWLYPALLSATPADFEAQMVSLRARHHLLALTDLLDAHRGATTLPRGALLITFDDAYHDFADNAWPILTRLSIPVTLFVPTAFPGAESRSFWWDRLWQAVMAAPRGARLGTSAGTVTLDDETVRRRAARVLIDGHKRLQHDAAMRSVDDICARLGAARPRSAVLGWDALRRLGEEGVDLASHSRTHPLFTRIPPAEMNQEIEASRADLEAHLPGSHPSVFAYPGGAHDDATRAALSAAGTELAFTTERGVNRLGRADPLRLRRINVGLRSNPALIRAEIAISAMRP